MANPVALVTGGSKGIGLGIAKALAKRGLDLILIARTESDLDTAKETINQQWPAVRVSTLSADLTNPNAYRAMKDLVAQEYGKLDVLVNNAGDFKMLGDDIESPEKVAEEVSKLFTVNAIPASVLSHVMRPLLLKSKYPRQLDMLSSAALELFEGNNPYGPTKAAHERLSLQTVLDTAGKVRTYRVYPSNVATRLTAHFETPKLSADDVGEYAVDMMLTDAGTDLYLKMTGSGLVQAMFSMSYKHIDGLSLLAAHRALIAERFIPAIRQAKSQ